MKVNIFWDVASRSLPTSQKILIFHYTSDFPEMLATPNIPSRVEYCQDPTRLYAYTRVHQRVTLCLPVLFLSIPPTHNIRVSTPSYHPVHPPSSPAISQPSSPSRRAKPIEACSADQGVAVDARDKTLCFFSTSPGRKKVLEKTGTRRRFKNERNSPRDHTAASKTLSVYAYRNVK